MTTYLERLKLLNSEAFTRQNPEAYRWCGYAAAVAGDKASRKGLARGCGRQRWTDVVAREYRVLLFGRGEAHAGGETGDSRYVKAKPQNSLFHDHLTNRIAE